VSFIGLGVTGGIGAYKAVEVVRLLQKQGHRVQVVMTRAARRFVGPLTFEAITRERVITSQFAPGLNAEIEHIAFGSAIDLLAVVPATANVLGKFAHGIADDFLTSLYLATRVPILVAPAMNTNMWEHPAVQANLATLRQRGVHVVDPGDGYLACGWMGAGRLAEPEAIADGITQLLTSQSRPWTGTRVLVTAGPTLEDLDAVRFIGNRSSGRMGFAVAQEALARGASVVVVAGPTNLAPPAGVETVRVRSAAEMAVAVMERSAEADLIVMAAAVADYTPARGVSPDKWEKREGMTLELTRTPDILAALGQARAGRGRPVLVGFAAQAGDPLPAARRKLRAKQVDLIVANDVSAPGAGFDVETNQVTFVSDREEALPLLSKREVARALLDRCDTLLRASATESVVHEQPSPTR
jgi:phosphopantothenoylcysteine decarboxylase/phosphopantothenate--cysteine ligase